MCPLSTGAEAQAANGVPGIGWHKFDTCAQGSSSLQIFQRAPSARPHTELCAWMRLTASILEQMRMTPMHL